MKTIAGCITITLLLVACQAPDGVYSPSCVAFEGDRITLHGDAFSWDKFTDMVVVDEDDEPIEQFPGFPVSGSFRIEGDSVLYSPDAGSAPPYRYLVSIDNGTYLFTAAERDAWRSSGETPDCALVLGGLQHD